MRQQQRKRREQTNRKRVEQQKIGSVGSRGKILEKRQAAAPEGTAASEEQKKKKAKQKESEHRDNAPRERDGRKAREDYNRCVSSSSRQQLLMKAA